ncbi:LEAF RUST 10 DISEASE-RESISTANCE LOCUS RECEPTOR-LIKE PROTEIN KINASE-like 2.1 isoform X2 [Solanum stenotomum]|uniref:LEAF RUST 10 DISEASE-RESISTANCE LOCUS RECEPTOR-LIKE PROTEIN KINASE-like 2.1 isoform X2 n=1 Tax=Solanum stenotomum TaxID=172797 RepID=UPI0020D13133|nr:LEAF RUST 10 DISEASE-RESISTANCE LOCUS RECEPTOR-LIKE PROTEIN KINASE-like 2.1 isoform X2 [Solanum stenotomum]
MHPYFLLFTTTIFILIYIPGSFCQDDERYKSCGEPFQCGSMNIIYPFWGGRKPEYCGHPSFEIKCESGIPKIAIESTRYEVIDINTPNRIVTLARDDLLSNICLANPENASFDLNTFSYVSSDLNITLYFGCTVRPGLQLPPSSPNRFNCNSNIFGIYTLINVPFDLSLVTCQEEIIARVNQTSAVALASPTASVEVLRRAIAGGFSVNWMAGIDSKCQQCGSSGGRCGSNPDSGEFACHCVNGTHPNDCNDGQRDLPGSVRIPTAAIVCIAGLAIISVPIIYCLRSRKSSCKSLICWKIESQDHKIEEFMRNYGSHAPKMYSYSDLKKITSSFSHKIGKGGFGQVYKGKLPDGRAVAVKVLTETNSDGEEYINEVASISRTSHVNIVGLLGFCYQRNRRALIYEYVSNGSLDKFLNSGSSSTTCSLEWTTLYSIAVGSARGLEYLHRGCNTRIVHFDIKPHNILLDEDFCPKISDFGLSRLCERKESILSMLGARGTAGYIAPEVFSRAFGHVSHKSDVYSYGMLVLEMVGVRNNVNMSQTSEVYFPNWIYEHLELGKDLSLQGIMNEEDEELARKMILVGLWCIQIKPSDRPAIEKAVEMLEGSLHSLQVPPKPVLFSPTRSIPESFTSTSTTTSERRFISGANIASE